jgi:hypothetical protein
LEEADAKWEYDPAMEQAFKDNLDATHTITMDTETLEPGQQFTQASFRIPVAYKAVQGQLTLSPPLLAVGHMYPGRTKNVTLYALNSFAVALDLCSITSGDPRVTPFLTRNSIPAHSKAEIGYVTIDPALCDPGDNYMPFRGAVSNVSSDVTPEEMLNMTARLKLWNRLYVQGEHRIRTEVPYSYSFSLADSYAPLQHHTYRT